MKVSKYSSNRLKKEIEVPGLGEVLLSNYENKRLAKLKDSSFLVSGTGKTEEEAIANLRKSYEQLSRRFQDSD
jgi:hypothetical protein